MQKMVCNHSFDVCIEFVYWSLLSQKVLLWYFTEFRAGIEHYAKGWYVNSSLLIEVTQKCILKTRSFCFCPRSIVILFKVNILFILIKCNFFYSFNDDIMNSNHYQILQSPRWQICIFMETGNVYCVKLFV